MHWDKWHFAHTHKHMQLETENTWGGEGVARLQGLWREDTFEDCPETALVPGIRHSASIRDLTWGDGHKGRMMLSGHPGFSTISVPHSDDSKYIENQHNKTLCEANSTNNTFNISDIWLWMNGCQVNFLRRKQPWRNPWENSMKKREWRIWCLALKKTVHTVFPPPQLDRSTLQHVTLPEPQAFKNEFQEKQRTKQNKQK